jgi:hypothetical protein
MDQSDCTPRQRHRLTLEDRKQIEELIQKKLNVNEICKQVKINRTTFYRDLKKCKNSYNAKEAHANTCKGYHPIDFDIIGKKFGLLTVQQYVTIRNRRTWWKCACDCGGETVMSRKMLAQPQSPDIPLSCGCVGKESKGPNGQVPIEEAALRKYQDILSFVKVRNHCWIWHGYRQQNKIPRTSWKNKAMSVRKCIYLIFNGITHEPNPVFSKCGNLYCVNPEHITLERPSTRSFYSEAY